MTIKENFLPVLTEVRKIRYRETLTYDRLIEMVVEKTDLNPLGVTVKAMNVLMNKDDKSEANFLAYVFTN